MPTNNYCEYFNVNETYFPCIDQSAIDAGVDWKTTYPHETFIELLNDTEKMLGGSTKRSIWIHGAYGTGKSQCAYALKKILEEPEEEVRAYWDKYEPLKKEKALLEKIIGHKKLGVVAPFRYASGSITTPQQLFFAVQESISRSLEEIPNAYKGENTLKESVIAWLDDQAHSNFINDLLKKPEWMSEFSQTTADEIINSLKGKGEVSGLMDSISKLASKEGITALSLTAESLCNWIKDIIDHNNTKIVLIWDEFSDFFRLNRNSLGEFQKIVSLCQETHFYFVIVTHPFTSIAGPTISKDDPMSVVLQRFNRVEITLPHNIAFELTGHAFSVIPTAKGQWEQLTNSLNAKVSSSRSAVMQATGISNEKIMQNMLPIHPMAALVLENIASAFQSNQRSMFDFIKTPKNLDVHAFQWFIQNTGPLSDRPLLTVDMLWDFFYEKGKDYLTSDIKLILDIFPQHSSNLTEKEKIVLKSILILQAVDQRRGGSIPLLKPTDQNLSYVFEGDWPEYETGCKNIAQSLVNQNILISTPIANGMSAYSTAVLAGDQAKIENLKESIRKTSTISKLVDAGTQLASVLSLSPALRLRFAINNDGDLPVVTCMNFTKVMDSLKDKDVDWHFYAVIALSKTEDEAQNFRQTIKKAISQEEYKNIVVIDALSSPLGLEEFENYVNYSAMAEYYNGNNNQQAKENSRKATEVLDRTWRDRIHDGSFTIWTYKNPNGEQVMGSGAVQTIMQTIVLNRFRYIPDFTNGLTETQLKLTNAKAVAKYGIDNGEVKGLISGCEKTVLGKVWNREKYWDDPALANEPISIIKKDLEDLIRKNFKESGRISIDDIYNYLEYEYGYSKCNLTAFIVGFLLKEYRSEPYSFQDSEGHREAMTSEKLSEMIGNYMTKNSKPTYIVSLTPEEKAFYEFTETAWGIPPETCTSPTHAGTLIQHKMRELVYPIWTLEEIDSNGIYDVVQKYIELVQNDGQEAHNTAIIIGKIGLQRPNDAESLNELLSPENCEKGMMSFLKCFNDGELLTLADEIGASSHVLNDIKNLFSVKHASQWIRETGEDEIRKLIVEYSFIKQTNLLLNVMTDTKDSALNAWRNTLKFLGISCESLQAKYPSLNKLFAQLLDIANQNDLIPDNINQLLEELVSHNSELQDILNNTTIVFSEIYAPYLEGLELSECEIIKNSIADNVFVMSETRSNAAVKKAAEEYKNNQIKTQLFELWKNSTNGTKNPRQWSEKYQVPILCCVDQDIYSEAKSTFDILNRSIQSESEIKLALDFLENNGEFLEKIKDADYRDNCFLEHVVGNYRILLPDIKKIKSSLEALSISPYDWYDDPRIHAKILSMANAEYKSGGSDAAIKKIESLDEKELKDWLKDIIKSDMEIGIKFISNEGQ